MHDKTPMVDQNCAAPIATSKPTELRLVMLDATASAESSASSITSRAVNNRGVPSAVDDCAQRSRSVAHHRRLSDAFGDAVRRFADHPALITGKRTFCYAELGAQSRRIASHLRADVQYRPGDRVAMILDNGPEFIAAYFGILAAGGTVVPLPPNIEPSRLARITGLCEASKVFTTERIVRRRPECAGGANCTTLDLTATRTDNESSWERHDTTEQAPAMIMFTSGSSGDPKGVILSDGNILANTESILRYLPITRDDRALALLPFYHAFGHSILQTHLLTGATLIVDGNMAFPSTIVDALGRHHATSFSAVPEGFYTLLSMSDLRDHKLPHLRYMSVAGGRLKPRAVGDMARTITPAEFFVMYGQTEASARLAYLPPELAQTHSDSIGKAIPGVELRVMTADGREASVSETGELCARGANVMAGYWNDPAGTNHVLQEGWLHTGDLACRDAQGLFYVKARKNDLVKVQGFRVHPREVEDAISQYFSELRVIVVPYEHQGATRLALFGITPMTDPTIADQLRRVCARELPRHKRPSLIEVLAQAPLNASMKLDRAALRRRATVRANAETEQDARDNPPRKMSA